MCANVIYFAKTHLDLCACENLSKANVYSSMCASTGRRTVRLFCCSARQRSTRNGRARGASNWVDESYLTCPSSARPIDATDNSRWVRISIDLKIAETCKLTSEWANKLRMAARKALNFY